MPQRAVPPQPMQISSWQQAEHNAARWMRHWGYTDAAARPGGPDSGIDVRATGALGQVKYQAAQVGRPELQRFVGARPYGSTAQLIFFTGSDYAPTAVAYAQEWNIALFRYRLDGTMTPVNDTARRIHRSSASTVPIAARNPETAEAQTFWKRNWRVVAGVCLLMAPLGSIGDEKTYTGPLALDVLKFIGILLVCWALGTFLIATRFGVRNSLKTRPFRAGIVSRPGTGPATTVGRTRAPRPTHDLAPASSTTQQDGLVAEAARLLRTGSKQHHVDKILRDRGVGFMERGRVLTEAKKLNKRS
ncbi:restriction endonuclease [Streptomyces fulvoviolaceus]|uniref:restriction endonuclease n=1 Tax=Streptomyces fulvoviolaceus TaxID=285535 RepID=UPI0009963C4B|nr:restriction endonuclease [Streptomyces fulvoviolaceus]MCT9084470.1 restriction endonuclease [Streptomyces fulvoviolaceus]